MSVLSSPVRRVLGDKDPNAPLQILSPNKTKVGTQDGSPIHNRSDLKRPASPTSYHITSPRAGQKRRLEEISLQPPSDPQSSPASLLQSSSQKTDMLNDSISQTSSSPQRTDPGKRSTPKPIWNSSFQASQEESQKFEQQFVIHDEMSQRALDSMHEVTMPDNASQSSQPKPTLATEASQLSLSMSSLIDFEGEEMEMIDEPDVVVNQKQTAQTQEDARKEMLLEKAETLRTRLQLAIYKIKSNQITTPFSRLQTPKQRSTSPESAFASSSPRSSSTVRAPSRLHRSVLTPETKVALARARATMETKPAVRSLSSIPVPTIMPTEYSARWMDDTNGSKQLSQSSQTLALPSSPPVVEDDGHGADSGAEVFEPQTPNQPSKLRCSQSSPSDCGSDPPTGQKDTVQNHLLRHGGLTSSVVKGEAANGLLELMRGVGTTSGGSGMCGI
ncbi:hypothetical protein B0A52_04205 [Exophiala mesophila]|uniref:Uncharacterized protein n=1 Tax=Exophiala mesophila TaxID=212818 RepID=A0A438N896_EXOME|nr:hypothetical protein B0A52_04205 [Exophiala mesophila]